MSFVLYLVGGIVAALLLLALFITTFLLCTLTFMFVDGIVDYFKEISSYGRRY